MPQDHCSRPINLGDNEVINLLDNSASTIMEDDSIAIESETNQNSALMPLEATDALDMNTSEETLNCPQEIPSSPLRDATDRDTSQRVIASVSETTDSKDQSNIHDISLDTVRINSSPTGEAIGTRTSSADIFPFPESANPSVPLIFRELCQTAVKEVFCLMKVLL